MKKSIIIITILGLFAAGSILAQHTGKNSFRQFGRSNTVPKSPKMNQNPFLGNSWDDILEKRKELNLTDEQRDKIKKMSFEFRTAQIDHRANIEKARLQLNHLKMDESSSEESVMAAIDNLAQARAESEKARFSFKRDVRSVLTKQQLEKLKELRTGHKNELGMYRPNFEKRINRDFRLDI